MDIETIRIILQHLDVKGRALILVLASSGMRINEALSVTLDDIALEAKPARITIREETAKSGENRISFFPPMQRRRLTNGLRSGRIISGRRQTAIMRL